MEPFTGLRILNRSDYKFRIATKIAATKADLHPEERIWPIEHAIYSVTENDVLCGRGSKTNLHPGNIKFRTIVAEHQDGYVTAKKVEKNEIGREIVRVVQRGGGRFLAKRLFPGGVYYWADIGEKDSIFKACQALRDRDKCKSKQNGEKSSRKGEPFLYSEGGKGSPLRKRRSRGDIESDFIRPFGESEPRKWRPTSSEKKRRGVKTSKAGDEGAIGVAQDQLSGNTQPVEQARPTRKLAQTVLVSSRAPDFESIMSRQRAHQGMGSARFANAKALVEGNVVDDKVALIPPLGVGYNLTATDEISWAASFRAAPHSQS